MTTPPTHQQLPILVVDDEASDRYLLVETLRLAGYATVEADSISTASAVIESTPLLGIILDQHLPDGLGSDLLRRLRSDAGHDRTPVLLVTGDATPALEVASLEGGATDFLLKPVTPDVLVARVAAHLRDRAAWLALLADGPGDPPGHAPDHTGLVRDPEFISVFQPIFDLSTGHVVGWEALTRFGAGADPKRWFDRAYRRGKGEALELATLATAVETAGRLEPSEFLSLNVSARLILRCSGELDGILSRSAHSLVLELTEHEPVDDYDAVRDALTALRTQVRLSVDDAGAGFASLRHVLSLNPDFIKLDRSWVTGLDGDPARRAIVSGIVHFAETVQSTVIAEGVETIGELEAVHGLGVELGQGYLLGRPAEARVHA